MTTITPPTARHKAEFFGDSLSINIPSRKHWFQIPFLAIWLLFWAGGWLAVTTSILHSPFEAGGFMLVWLAAWTVGGVYTMSSLLWMLVGVERIEISPDIFQVQRQVLGLGSTKTFATLDVYALRVTSTRSSSNFWGSYGRRRQLNTIWHFDGPITFDYGAKTYRIGEGVDEAEAKQIVKLIQQHFPLFFKES
ncbi:MAG: hypothetical protein GY796_05365 [Chloroflexi bacterium]|nr:hypothetical protein [Chloroflexota bacterium]